MAANFALPPSFLHMSMGPGSNLMVLSRPDGFSVFEINPLRELQRRQFTNSFGCSQAYLLGNTSLFALVLDTTERLEQRLAGQPLSEHDSELNPCNLLLFDDKTQTIQARLRFSTEILQARVTQRSLYVSLRKEIHIYSLRELSLTDVVPVLENSAIFDVYEDEDLALLAYCSATKTGRLGINYYGQKAQTKFIDCSISHITAAKFSPSGRQVVVGTEHGKVIKRFNVINEQLTALLKRSSEAARIISLDYSDAFISVCSTKGTVHIFKAEGENPLTLEDLDNIEEVKQGSVRETRAFETYKAVAPGVLHVAAFSKNEELIIITETGEYQKVNFCAGQNEKLVSKWSLE